METGSHELAILSYATVCLLPSVSLNNDKICHEFSEHKIAVCEKTAGLQSGNYLDLNSACLKVLVPIEIFQFLDMHYETQQMLYKKFQIKQTHILSVSSMYNIVWL